MNENQFLYNSKFGESCEHFLFSFRGFVLAGVVIKTKTKLNQITLLVKYGFPLDNLFFR